MSEISTSRIHRIYINLLALGVLFLFPILQSYSILRSLGFPSIYLPIAIYFILTIALLLKFIRDFSEKKTSITLSYIIICGVLICVISTILFYGLKFGLDSAYRTQYFSTLQTGVIYTLLCFLIGLDFDYVFYQLKNNKWIKMVAKVSILVLVTIVIVSMLVNYKEIGVFQIKYTTDYLAISDGIAVSLLVIFAIIKDVKIQIILIPIFIIIMLGTISRGSMLSLVGAIFSYKIIGFKAKPIKIASLFASIFLFTFLYIYVYENQIYLSNLFGRSRGVDIFISIVSQQKSFFENDPSAMARIQMLQFGLADLKNIWFFGSFMRDAEIGIGYVHNWLSFWINYGFIPFVLFSFTYITSLIKCIIIYRKKSYEVLSVVIILSFYTLFQVVLFRAYVYATVWLSVAALVSFIRESKTYRVDNIINKLR